MDDFGSHERVLNAHRHFREERCIPIKEDLNTSYINQRYDQSVAQNDQKVALKTLVPKSKTICTQNHGRKLYQWILINTVTTLVVATMEEMWQSSSNVINVHPLGRK